MKLNSVPLAWSKSPSRHPVRIGSPQHRLRPPQEVSFRKLPFIPEQRERPAGPLVPRSARCYPYAYHGPYGESSAVSSHPVCLTRTNNTATLWHSSTLHEQFIVLNIFVKHVLFATSKKNHVADGILFRLASNTLANFLFFLGPLGSYITASVLPFWHFALTNETLLFVLAK